MVRREIMDGKPPTKYAPHATQNEWRAGRRDIPPPMTSQALTISARHTSSTAPTRLRRRHSLRDNEWRAIVRAWIAEVQRPFLSNHSPRRGIAPAVGDIPWVTFHSKRRKPRFAAVGQPAPARATPL